MKPLIVLLAAFLISLLALKLTQGTYEYALSARVAMSVMLVFTAVAHFAFTKGMVRMVPAFIPFKKAMVYFTGFVEITAAAGLQIAELRVLTAWLLILFFAVLLPANIKAAKERIDYQKGTDDGNGIAYLWFRVPLQIFFIGWVYFAVVAN